MNTLIIKRYSESKMLRAKTDAVDAGLISNSGYEQIPPTFIPRSAHQRQMIGLLKMLEDIVQIRTEYERRIEALNQNPDAMKAIIRSNKRLIRILNSEMEPLEEMALQIPKTHRAI